MTRKPIIYTADAVRMDGDEGRIAIIIDTDEGDKLYVDIHSVALDFYASVQANLRPYVLEAEDARRTMPEVRDEQADSGYELDDPKHPTFFERMVD